jgi:hypothetical protein
MKSRPVPAFGRALPAAAPPLYRAPAVRAVLRGPRIQPKPGIGAVNDPAEREADRVADQVMRVPDTAIQQSTAGGTIQRLCADCEDELQRKETNAADSHSGPPTPAMEAALGSLGSGAPLPASERTFFEPRFGRRFDSVRIHRGSSAGTAARTIGARAFTFGNSIVLDSSQYAPGTHAGRALLAHELTHVVQQGAVGAPQIVRRQTIHSSCAGQESVLQDAWAEGLRLTQQTIESLDNTWQSIRYGRTPAFLARMIENAFGDVGLAEGLTRLPGLIERYERILRGFQSGRTLRCDIGSVSVDQDECDQFSAFVVPGNATDIFICPSFFEAHMNPTSLGVTLVHEMAHSALRIGHQGGVLQHFDCERAVGLDYDDAKLNAYPYGILADCLHGEGTQAEEVVVPRPAPAASVAGRSEARWSISGAAGADVTPDAQRLAAALGGRVSLAGGEFVVWNPVVGLNLLYLPSSSADSSHLLAATADLGLRMQQPLEGLYFDISAGGFVGFDIDPGHEPAAELTGGPTGAAGLGWRWRHIEVGAEARALLPEADFDRTQVLVFGRVGLRFE